MEKFTAENVWFALVVLVIVIGAVLGVARNISYNQENSAFEGWCVNTDGVIKTSCTSIYPLEGGKVILAGTICYAVS